MEINILQILFQAVNFGVVFGALTFFLYKPILKVLDDRRKKTEEAQIFAEEASREKEEIESMKKRAKTQADKDAVKVMEEAKEEVKALKAKLTKEAKEEVTELRKKELAKVEAETKARAAAAEAEVTKLSIAIASKVLGKAVDAKEHKSLIASSIKELDKLVAGM